MFAEETGVLVHIIAVFSIFLVVCLHLIPMWLAIAAWTISEDRPPRKLDGDAYSYGSCSTGGFMRRQLLETSSRRFQLLFRFLLRVERFPYWLYLFLAFVVNVFTCLGDLWIPSLSLGLSDKHTPNEVSEHVKLLGGLTLYWAIGAMYIGRTWRDQNSRVREGLVLGSSS